MLSEKDHTEYVRALSEKAGYFDKIKCIVLSEDITRSSYGISFFVEKLIGMKKVFERLLSEETLSIDFGDCSIDKEGFNNWVIYFYDKQGEGIASRSGFPSFDDAYTHLLDLREHGNR